MKISVVTPSYGQLDWVKLCIASVRDEANWLDEHREQGFQCQVEHIIQDGGTEGIDCIRAFEVASDHYSMTLYVEPDEGMYDAINKGLAKASGDILGYLNCDEQYAPGALERIVRYLHDHPGVNALFGDFILMDEAGLPLSYRRVVLPDRLHTRLEHLNTATCATFFRRGVMEEGCVFDTSWKTIADAVWVYEMIKSGKKLAVLEEPLAYFSFTGQNLGSSKVFEEERREWRAGVRMGSVLRPVCKGMYMARKWAAGAYASRKVTVAPYTQISWPERVVSKDFELSYKWPMERKYREDGAV